MLSLYIIYIYTYIQYVFPWYTSTRVKTTSVQIHTAQHCQQMLPWQFLFPIPKMVDFQRLTWSVEKFSTPFRALVHHHFPIIIGDL